MKRFIVSYFAVLLLQSGSILFAQDSRPIPVRVPDELDSLVAPIALYPDPLLGQVLAASTRPLEIAEASQWLQQNSTLSGTALQDAAGSQDWDPSVEALLLFPDVLHWLSGNIQWTTDVGEAFMSQQIGVMDAVQRMRARAVASSSISSNSQVIVTPQYQGTTTYIEIQPAQPDVIYVPAYDPVVVWGPARYAYPAIRYVRGPVVVVPGRISYFPRVRPSGVFINWRGWNDWGWRPNWYGRTVIVNNNFFHRHFYRRPVVPYRTYNNRVFTNYRPAPLRPPQAVFRPNTPSIARPNIARPSFGRVGPVRPNPSRQFERRVPGRQPQVRQFEPRVREPRVGGSFGRLPDRTPQMRPRGSGEGSRGNGRGRQNAPQRQVERRGGRN